MVREQTSRVEFPFDNAAFASERLRAHLKSFGSFQQDCTHVEQSRIWYAIVIAVVSPESRSLSLSLVILG